MALGSASRARNVRQLLRSPPVRSASQFGDATGTYEANAQGLPVTVTLEAGFGEIVVKQE